jgi:transcriptional regulator with XRE-family HTH domain
VNGTLNVSSGVEPDDTSSSLAALLRARRLQLGLTLTEVARQAGISRTYLQRLERPDRGISPSGTVLGRLRQVLHLEAHEILAPTHMPAGTLPASLGDYLEEVHPAANVAAALTTLAPYASANLSRDDWVILHRVLVATLLRPGVRARSS